MAQFVVNFECPERSCYVVPIILGHCIKVRSKFTSESRLAFGAGPGEMAAAAGRRRRRVGREGVRRTARGARVGRGGRPMSGGQAASRDEKTSLIVGDDTRSIRQYKLSTAVITSQPRRLCDPYCLSVSLSVCVKRITPKNWTVPNDMVWPVWVDRRRGNKSKRVT